MSELNLQILRQIVVDATSAHTLEEQIQRIVSDVQRVMEVDVCSLYDLEDGRRLRLVANVGFPPEVVGNITLEVGEGLVGWVAEHQVPLNEAHASENPAYRYFPETGEAVFDAFLGVPIVHLGQTIGVIVVQDRAARRFTSVEEAFCTTIAAQIAASLVRLPRRGTARERSAGQRTLQGRTGSGGKAIGRLHIVVSEMTMQFVEPPEHGSIAEESEKLDRAVERVQRDIAAAREQLKGQVGAEMLDLFEFYDLALSEEQWLGDVRARVDAGLSAFEAVRATVDETAKAFEAVEDAYLRARLDDFRQIGNKLLAAMLDLASVDTSEMEDVVLLGDLVSVTDIGRFRPEQLAAIVSLQGSSLSHTAVLAGALDLPAVMGLGPVDHISEGDVAIVDGDTGAVTLNPTTVLLDAYRLMIDEDQTLRHEFDELIGRPAETRDGVRVTIMTNTGLLADARPGLARGAEGVGLYRSEGPFLAGNAFPTEDDQYRVYRDVLELYHPRPVVIRTLDAGGDKPLPYFSVAEDNPALGWRGIRFTLDNRAIFMTQLKAMLRANVGLGNLAVMLPMVADLNDVLESKRLLEEVAESLGDALGDLDLPRLGIMLEVPAIVPLLEHFAGVIDFVSIGSNDLTQYLLAVDRANPRVAGRYDPLHPSVLIVMHDAVRRCLAAGLDVSVCGEMAGDPAGAILLIGMGVRSLSMNAANLPRMKGVVMGIDTAACRDALDEALALTDAESIRRRVRERFPDLARLFR